MPVALPDQFFQSVCHRLPVGCFPDIGKRHILRQIQQGMVPVIKGRGLTHTQNPVPVQQINPCLAHVAAEIAAHGQGGRSQKIWFPAAPQILMEQEIKVLWQDAEPAGRHPCIFQPADKILIVT